MADFDQQRFNQSVAVATGGPQVLVPNGERLVSFSVRQLTSGTPFYVRLGFNGPPTLLYERDTFDLNDEDFKDGLFYEIGAGPPAGATIDMILYTKHG